MMYLGTVVRYAVAAAGFANSYEIARRGLVSHTNRNIDNLKEKLKINEDAIKHAQKALATIPENQRRQAEEGYHDLVNNQFSKVHYGFNTEIPSTEAQEIVKNLELKRKFYSRVLNILPFWPERQ